jgi:hypothetical protein
MTWASFGSAALAVGGDMQSIRFETRTRLAYKGSNGFGALMLSVPGASSATKPSALAVTAVMRRPSRVSVVLAAETVDAQVVDWVCR